MAAPIATVLLFLLIHVVNLTAGNNILSTILFASTFHDESSNPLEEYIHARDVRIKEGHRAAAPLYEKLITKHGDITAATRIAAALSSPERHDRSCPLPNEDVDDDNVMKAIIRMRSILEKSDYNNPCIQKIFGIKPLETAIDPSSVLTKTESLAFAKGPVYVKPVSARAQSQLPMFLQSLNIENEAESSLKCLVALFLLGFTGKDFSNRLVIRCLWINLILCCMLTTNYHK